VKSKRDEAEQGRHRAEPQRRGKRDWVILVVADYLYPRGDNDGEAKNKGGICMGSELITLLYVGLPFAGLIIGIAGLIIGACTKKKVVFRLGASLLCLEAFVALWAFTLLLLLLSVAVLQWLAYVVCGGLFIICLLCIWKPFQVKPRRVVILSLAAVLVLITGSALGVRVYQNSIVEVHEDDINLRQYMPFDEETRAVSLDEPSTLVLSNNLPRLDGATALYPLYSAFVRATYPKGDYSPYASLGSDFSSYDEVTTPIACHRTEAAFEHLLDGSADIVFLMDISDEQRRMAEEQGLTLTLTPIGREAFVFLVNSQNEITNLEQDEVRAIYSGEVTDWSEVGDGSISGSIDVYQRPENSGSQIALRKLMGTTPIIEPKSEQVQSFMGGMYTVVSSYKNYKNALGYSFRFYINGMLNDVELRKVRLLTIDGIAPTVENITDSSYPFSDDFYAVTVEGRAYTSEDQRLRAENAEKLLDWILSSQGQSLVEKTGYVPLAK
jgi:phosphate transport system substrate-binding protein